MRATAFLVCLILMSCTAATPSDTPSEPPALQYRLVASGSQTTRPVGPRHILVTTAAEYERQWAALIGSGSVAPPIDFAHESVVFLLGGQKPTGGFTVVPRKVSIEGNTLVIDATVASPPEGSMNIQVLTSPWSVLALEKKGATTSRWVNQPAGDSATQ